MFIPGISRDLDRMDRVVRMIGPDRDVVVTDSNFGSRRRLIRLIGRACWNANRVLMYYTGHAVEGCLLLPDGDQISMNRIRGIIGRTCHRNAEVLCLFDCCESSGLNLEFRMSPGGTYRHHRHASIKQSCLCLSSSSKHRKSFSTKSGSVFTREISRGLLSQTIKLRKEFRKKLERELDRELQAKLGTKAGKEFGRQLGKDILITSTRSDLYTLWPWCFGR